LIHAPDGCSVREERVGGRTWNRPITAAVVDAGEEFVGPTQDRIKALANRRERVGRRTVQPRRPCRRPRPGTLLDFGPSLRQPVGRIHWAGTDTSDYWVGYMDGAVCSGGRAAAEVLAEL
jgi:monoamine oxidase